MLAEAKFEDATQRVDHVLACLGAVPTLAVRAGTSGMDARIQPSSPSS
jgi:hypothetical protein